MSGWIGVDLDGTLARYDGTIEEVGEPLPLMVELVQVLLARGNQVKIFTARVSVPEIEDEQRAMIEAWCEEHLGQILPVTNVKDLGMIQLYDDRAVAIEHNTGVDSYTKLVGILQEALSYLTDHQDVGTRDDGWKSDELLDLIRRTQKVLGQKVT